MTAAARHMGGGFFVLYFTCPGCGNKARIDDFDPSTLGVETDHDRIRMYCKICKGSWVYSGLFNAAIRAWAALMPPEERKAG